MSASVSNPDIKDANYQKEKAARRRLDTVQGEANRR